MRVFIVACLILFGSAANAQSLRDARKYFDNYEYQRAFNAYKSLSLNDDLPDDDQKRYAYSGFTVGEYAKTFDVVGKVLQQSDVEPYFYFIHGEICLNLGKYDDAKASYEKYASMDNEYDVSVKIQTCNEKPGWSSMEHIDNVSISSNTSKADISGRIHADMTVLFHEAGTDSVGTFMDGEQIDFSELVVSKPFFDYGNGEEVPAIIQDSLGLAAITSFEILENSKQVIFTVAEPTKADPVLKAPHLYIGDWIMEYGVVKNVEPWIYSGFEDTSACAQATVDASGKRIVFTKIGNETKGSDLYITTLENGVWSQPEPLNAINTKFDEMFPTFQGDSMLTFSSDGRPGYGKLDLYAYSFASGEVTHFKAPVNSDMDDFNMYYYEGADSALYTSNRAGGMGDDDRYFVKFREPVKEVEIDTVEFEVNWVDQKIYFDFDKYSLMKDVKILDQIIEYLSVKKDSKIILEAHTDRRGTDSYNQRLSEERAASVKSELIAEGINAGQIEIVALGESAPLVDCGECTEKMHAENRVVVLKLKTK